MRRLLACLALLLCSPTDAQTPAPDVVLTGELAGADHQTYRELPFEVPSGVEAVTVRFAYTGRDKRTTIDLGLYDNERFRGWSGGNKAEFTIAETEATPSYLPGPIRPGTWKLLLGVPNIRKEARATYKAEISFRRASDPPPVSAFANGPLVAQARWYRGDLHAHSGNSDGSCLSQSGARVPCPLYRTVEAAAARGLDFVAITEHNTTSHHNALRELQPAFDRLLLIPGREITTFAGHANIFGTTRQIDFQLGSERAPTVATILRQVEAAGALVSINHPSSPSGERCMGCGWTAPDTDWTGVQAIEVINGGSVRALGAVETPLLGVRFWESRLDEGRRLTAIAGSDNHDALLSPETPSAVGSPTTVIYAEELSQAALMAGLRAGRAFVDIEGTRDRALDFTLAAGGQTVRMGGVLNTLGASTMTADVRVIGVPGGRIELVGSGGRVLARLPIAAGREVHSARISPDRSLRWVRAEVRGADGRLLLLGNPIYMGTRKPTGR